MRSFSSAEAVVAPLKAGGDAVSWRPPPSWRRLGRRCGEASNEPSSAPATCPIRATPLRALSRLCGRGVGFDVMVHPEQIRGIVPVLQCDQPLADTRQVGALEEVGALIARVVDVDGVRE